MPRQFNPVRGREWGVGLKRCARCGHPFFVDRRSRQRYCKPCRFWSRVDASGGSDACWPWTGVTVESGYGHVRWDGAQLRTHRLAWVLTHGAIPDGLLVLHTCEARYPVGDTGHRRCCNPAHLKLGTHQDNMDDLVRSGRVATGQRSGSYTKPHTRNYGARNARHTHPETTARGERHGRATFTPEQVTAIRLAYLAGETNCAALARRFGGTKGGVYALIAGRTWNHLPWPTLG